MSIIEIHGRLANTALYFCIAMAVWGLFRYFRKQGVDSNYWGAMAIAEVLLIIQSSLGAYIYFSGIGNLAGKMIHILYGVVAILVIPGVFAYVKGDQQRRGMVVYGVAFLFLIGIVLRAMTTAH